MSIERYRQFINELPPPGGGGAHQALYRAGCLGCRAGLTAESVVADVRTHLPEGSRVVSDAEIEQGVEAGFAEVSGGVKRPSSIGPRIRPGALESILREGRGATEADVRRRSPVKLDWPEGEGWRVLEALFGTGELLFVGDDGISGRIGETIRPAGDWIEKFRREATVPFPKIMVNGLTGRWAAKKSGDGRTLRGDGCVAEHRFAVAEFDDLSIEDQIAFWIAVPNLPVAALIHSGKKSLHAWVRVDCSDRIEWEREVEQTLFPGYLKPLGLDPACKNASRISRMPGHRRSDTGKIQSCLYLAPKGKAVSA